MKNRSHRHPETPSYPQAPCRAKPLGRLAQGAQITITARAKDRPPRGRIYGCSRSHFITTSACKSGGVHIRISAAPSAISNASIGCYRSERTLCPAAYARPGRCARNYFTRTVVCPRRKALSFSLRCGAPRLSPGPHLLGAITMDSLKSTRSITRRATIFMWPFDGASKSLHRAEVAVNRC